MLLSISKKNLSPLRLRTLETPQLCTHLRLQQVTQVRPQEKHKNLHIVELDNQLAKHSPAVRQLTAPVAPYILPAAPLQT